MPLLGIGAFPSRTSEVAAATVFSILAMFTTASAVVASPEREERPIEIVFAGADRDVALVRGIVLELLERDRIVFSWSQHVSIEPQSFSSRVGGAAAARIGIDVTRSNEVRLLLTRSDGDEVVVRRVALSQGLDEVGREVIGQIVESTALALAKGLGTQPSPGDSMAPPHALPSEGVPLGTVTSEAAGATVSPNNENSVVSTRDASSPANSEKPLKANDVSNLVSDPRSASNRSSASNPSSGSNPSSASNSSRPEPPNGPNAATSVSPRVPVGPRRPEVFFHYRIGLGYAADAFLSGPLAQHGPLFASALMLGRSSARMVLGFSVRYDVPVSASTDKVALRFDGAIARIEVGAELWQGSRGWVSVLAGGGLDVTRVVPERVLDSTLALAPPVVVASAAARASIGAGRRIMPSVDLSFFLHADFSLSHAHYDVYQDGTTSPTLTPWPIRPGASLTLCFAR